MKARKYKKQFNHAYTYGLFPTLDLFKYKKEQIIKIMLHEKGRKSDHVRKLVALCEANNVPYEFVSKAIERISAKENTYAIGIFEKYEERIDKDQNHIMLVNPTNTGNLGTIIRTMAGFGFHDLAIIKPGVDIFDAMVIRSSMGAFFEVKCQYFTDFEDYKKRFAKHNIYTFMLDGAQSIEQVKYKKHYTLVFGNEGAGLPREYKDYGQSVFIPHGDNIDSLNLSVAAGIAMYKTTIK